jgi:DNA-binding NarL/FixJ family response regulator
MFRTLIIEDHLGFQALLKETLHSVSPTMEITEAADGDEAYEKISSSCPNLIFMDIRLPGENGLELTRRIKAEYPETIIIVLTSYDFPEYREAARRNGADHFLLKGSATREHIETLVKFIVSNWRTDSHD